MVIGWPTDVNTLIVDSTTGTIGDSGFKEQTLDNGVVDRRLTTFVTPRTFSVTMDFDWHEKDSNGFSEFDRFERWFAYRHQSGSNPFWFDSIARFNINGSALDSKGNPIQCQYRISKGYTFSKYGLCMRVQMTWVEVYSGLVTYTTPENTVDYINAVNGTVSVYYTSSLSEVPTLTSLSLKYIDVNGGSDITDIDNYSSFSPTRVTVSGKEADFTVASLSSGTYKIVIDDGSEEVSSMKSVVLTVE